MNICYITSDWGVWTDGETPLPGGAGWYRSYLPAKALATYGGHSTCVVPNAGQRPSGELCGVDHDGTVYDGCDVVVIQRWMHQDAAGVIAKAVAAGQTVLNDVDDWYWGLDPSNRAWANSHPKANPYANVNHYRAALAAGSGLVASTPYLAGRLQDMVHMPCQVVRNHIDLERWTSLAMRRDHRAVGATPVYGWVGATPWRSGDLETLRGVLGPVLRQLGCSFYHGGHLPGQPRAADQLGLAGVPCTDRAIQPITDYPQLFRHLDVGVVPLRMAPFNEAKSCIKGMEYAAAGVPYVAAATGEYRWAVDELGMGRVARNPQQWRNHLVALADPEVRREDARRNLVAVQGLHVRDGWRAWQRALTCV